MQRRVEDDRVDRRVHCIEYPAKPCDEQDQPLVSCDAVPPRFCYHHISLSGSRRRTLFGLFGLSRLFG
jgi:hypothetical protein